MKNSIRVYALLAVALTSIAQLPTPSSPNENLVTVKEMLISGPPQLKMHSLAMIIQKQTAGNIDASYLDAFGKLVAPTLLHLFDPSLPAFWVNTSFKIK